ncbi:MAG: hypothetical protein PGN13_16010 [Patulibacter minatonensis]
MTRAQLKASRISWRRKRAWRQRRYLAAKRTSDTALQAKWKKLLSEADRMIARRTEQLEASRPLRARAFDVAEGLIGVMEHGGNNRGEMVEKIIRANGGIAGEPWCGDFVAWCYRAAGSKAVTRAWASVYFLGRIAGVVKISADDVRRGDIVRYSFSHTGLFDEWIDRAAGTFKAVEGNTGASGAVSDSSTGGDGVYRKADRRLSQVTDFRRVTK